MLKDQMCNEISHDSTSVKCTLWPYYLKTCVTCAPVYFVQVLIGAENAEKSLLSVYFAHQTIFGKTMSREPQKGTSYE